MANDQPTGREPAVQANVLAFPQVSARHRLASSRVRLREFTFALASSTQTQALMASWKDSLQWAARQGHEPPGLPPASALPTYQL